MDLHPRVKSLALQLKVLRLLWYYSERPTPDETQHIYMSSLACGNLVANDQQSMLLRQDP